MFPERLNDLAFGESFGNKEAKLSSYKDGAAVHVVISTTQRQLCQQRVGRKR